MSWCRWSDFDIYVYENCNGFITCCSCPFLGAIEEGKNADFPTAKKMIQHIEEHRKAGHVVPNNLDLKRFSSERDEDREKRLRRRMRNSKY